MTHLARVSFSQNCFELFIPDHKDQVIKACKTEADGRVVEGNHTFYRISAPTAEEKDEWINSIKWVTFKLWFLLFWVFFFCLLRLTILHVSPLQSRDKQRPVLRDAGCSEEEGFLSEGAVELLRIEHWNKHRFDLSMQNWLWTWFSSRCSNVDLTKDSTFPLSPFWTLVSSEQTRLSLQVWPDVEYFISHR